MRNFFLLSATVLLLAGITNAASKPHVISFAKWTTVKCFVGPDENQETDLKVRALLVDARVKEYTTGNAHDVTERYFVAQRAFRVNDGLPDESATPKWRWQRGGWLLVDRITSRISPVVLPEFDPYSSLAAWYRDYVAYCGVSDDGKKTSAFVVQLGQRKPVLRSVLKNSGDEHVCAVPKWTRQPAQVSFEPEGSPKVTYAIRGRAVDLVTESDDDDDEASK